MEDKSEKVEKKLHELGLEIQEFKAEFSDYSEKVRRALTLAEGGDGE